MRKSYTKFYENSQVILGHPLTFGQIPNRLDTTQRRDHALDALPKDRMDLLLNTAFSGILTYEISFCVYLSQYGRKQEMTNGSSRFSGQNVCLRVRSLRISHSSAKGLDLLSIDVRKFRINVGFLITELSQIF